MFNEYYDAATQTYRTNPAYKEILKLDKMLTEANIPHTLAESFDGWQVCYPCAMGPDIVMDAIEHYGSYGNSCDELEIMGLLTPEESEHDSVVGCLTAEDVFERIRKHYNGEWDKYIESMSGTDSEETSTDDAPITPEKFADQMREAYQLYYVGNDDAEDVHIAMDGIICNLLRQLGYGEGVDIFNSTPKWYA